MASLKEREMSQHPSLKGSEHGTKFRSVLKRYEKIKELAEKEKWDEEKDSIYRLPKVKRIKFKVKKAKGPEEEEGAEAVAAEGTAAPAAGDAGAAGAKEATPAEGKKEEKKKK